MLLKLRNTQILHEGADVMASSVFYRFKSQKEPSRITFDGTGISVFELKRAIIESSNLGDGTDFELTLTSPDGNESEFITLKAAVSMFLTGHSIR